MYTSVCICTQRHMYSCMISIGLSCRSCDSTFGLGSLSNEDDLCWFSSSDFTERSDDALNLGSKFLNSEASALDSVSEHPEASQLSSDDPSVYDSNKKSIFTDDKISSRTSSAVDHSSLGYLTFLNGSETKSASMDDLVLKEKVGEVFMFLNNIFFSILFRLADIT